MKKSFSIIETIISILLLSVVIATLLQNKNNNLYILSSVENRGILDRFISLVSISSIQKDKTIYLKDLLSTKNENIKKKLGDEKINYKNKNVDVLNIKSDNTLLKIKISQEKYQHETYGQKEFYRFELDE